MGLSPSRCRGALPQAAWCVLAISGKIGLQTETNFDFTNDVLTGVTPIIRITRQFTLLQLMMTVTLAAILLGMAASDFSNGWNRPTCRVCSLAFSSSGKRLAVVSYRSDYLDSRPEPYVRLWRQIGTLDQATANIEVIVDEERWQEKHPASDRRKALIAFGPDEKTVLSQYDRNHPTIAAYLLDGPGGAALDFPEARTVRLAVTANGMHACFAKVTDLPCLLLFSSCHLTYDTSPLITILGAPAQGIESLTILSGESQNALSCLTLSENGKLVAFANPTRIDVRRTADKRSVAELVLPHEHGRLSTVAFSPDSQTLAVATQKRLLLHDLASKQERELFHADDLGPMAFAPDGKTVVIGEGSCLCQIEVASGQVVRTLQAAGEVASVAYSPTGDAVAVGDAEGYVSLWNPVTGQRVWRVGAPGCPGISWIYSVVALGFWAIVCGWFWSHRRRHSRVHPPKTDEKTAVWLDHQTQPPQLQEDNSSPACHTRPGIP